MTRGETDPFSDEGGGGRFSDSCDHEMPRGVVESRHGAGPGRWAGLIAVAVVAAIFIGVNLGSYALWDPDEAKHAEVAREMLISGNWIEPQVDFQPYHHKPSLLYLLIASSYNLFGVSELSARLVPALACWLTLLAVYWYSSRRSLRAGFLAALLLAACPLFTGVGRFTNFDGLVTCFTAAAVLWFASWLDRPSSRSGVDPFYALVALGVLAKGPMAIVVVAVPVLVAVWRRDVVWSDLRPLRGLLVLAAIVGVWALPIGVLAPGYLIDFVWIHNVQRYLVPQPAFHPEPIYFFVPLTIVALLPWSLLLPWILRDALSGPPGVRLLAVYALWIVAFFSFSSGKLPTYVLPAFPALAVLAAQWLDGKDGHRGGVARMLIDIAAALMAVLPIVAWLVIRREARELIPYVLVLVPVSAAGLWTLARGRRVFPGVRGAVTTLCTGLAATLLVFNVVGGPAVSRLTSDEDLARVAKSLGRPDRVVAFGVRPYSFLFYTGWPIVYQVSDEDYRRSLQGDGTVFLLTKERRLGRLREIAGDLRLHELGRNDRHILFRVDPVQSSVDPARSPVCRLPSALSLIT